MAPSDQRHVSRMDSKMKYESTILTGFVTIIIYFILGHLIYTFIKDGFSLISLLFVFIASTIAFSITSLLIVVYHNEKNKIKIHKKL